MRTLNGVVWPSPELYNPEHTPNCGTCIGAVLNNPSTTPDAKIAISEIAGLARKTIDPFVVRAWAKPIMVSYGMYPPREVVEVVREFEGRLAEVRDLVPLAHMLTSVPWPEFEFPDVFPESRTTTELIRGCEITA